MRTLCTDLHLALLVRHAQPVVGLVLPHVGGQQSGAAVRIAGIVGLNISRSVAFGRCFCLKPVLGSHTWKIERAQCI